MGESIGDVPEIWFPEDISMTGEYPARLARAAAELGPILRVSLEGRNDLIFMVGPDANRFVLHTHREHFSHEQGWTPVLGDWFGHGLLNMDPPEHTQHRKRMNPAFTSAFLGVYL